MVILEVKNLSKYFGGLAANKNISFIVKQEEIVGIIGPNGAGKTCLFNCITGFLKPSSGEIWFRGEEITGWRAFKINRKGIARTFQIVHSFKDMTVLENVMIGTLCHTQDIEISREKAEEILDFVGLWSKRNMLTKELPIATQKRVELARALATEPSLLMLDEVMSGLTQNEANEAIDLIKKIFEKKGITLILIEHIMEILMPLSTHVIVLDNGEKIAEGKPEDIIRNPRVIQAYLGEKYARSQSY